LSEWDSGRSVAVLRVERVGQWKECSSPGFESMVGDNRERSAAIGWIVWRCYYGRSAVQRSFGENSGGSSEQRVAAIRRVRLLQRWGSEVQMVSL